MSIYSIPRHKYLRPDHYMAGYDHWEDDHALYITFKGQTIGIFPAWKPLESNDAIHKCADGYQAALERAGLGQGGGIEFGRESK